ncbi:hypothetical protein F4780DRAFT_185156 [Xylariomycetidae sp. FL0641]|nr:hypothetical protein F4780DRAFT_185156 [Xylariomycetidae sp. FL0641]
MSCCSSSFSASAAAPRPTWQQQPNPHNVGWWQLPRHGAVVGWWDERLRGQEDAGRCRSSSSVVAVGTWSETSPAAAFRAADEINAAAHAHARPLVPLAGRYPERPPRVEAGGIGARGEQFPYHDGDDDGGDPWDTPRTSRRPPGGEEERVIVIGNRGEQFPNDDDDDDLRNTPRTNTGPSGWYPEYVVPDAVRSPPLPLPPPPPPRHPDPAATQFSDFDFVAPAASNHSNHQHQHDGKKTPVGPLDDLAVPGRAAALAEAGPGTGLAAVFWSAPGDDADGEGTLVKGAYRPTDLTMSGGLG